MKKNTLFVFDLDGTLIDDNGVEKESIPELFALVLGFGFAKTAIMTGKGNYYVRDFCERNKIAPDYICGYEGNCITSACGEAIHSRPLSQEVDCEPLVEELLLHTTSVFLNKSDGLYRIQDPLPENSTLSRYELGVAKGWDDIYQIYARYVEKDSAKHLIEKHSPSLNAYCFPGKTGHRTSMLFSRHGGKKRNYETLFSLAKIDMGNGWYFGDGINDVEISQLPSNLIATDNAHHELKSVAKYALKSGESISSFIHKNFQ